MFWLHVTTLLVVACILHRYHTRRNARRAYDTFVKRNACEAPTQLPVKSGFRHKLNLLRSLYGDLFNDYYRGNFKSFGHTHAILDSIKRPKVVHTIDPDNVRAAVIFHHDDWGVFKTRRNALKPFAQEGILTTEGHVWQHNRKIIFRSLNTRRSRDTRSIEPHVQALFDSIDQHGAGVINISGFLRRMAIDLTSEYMLGMSTGLQSSGAESNEGWQKEIDELFKSWSVVQDFMTIRSVMGSRYWLADGLKFRRACAHFRSFFDTYLARIRTQLSAQDRSLAQDLLLELKDPVKVREALIEVLIAGQNMVGTTLEWTLAELAARPDIYSRLREEVLSTFGTVEDGNNVRLMTWDNLQTCKTLQNTISEVLRLHPLVPLIQRTSNKPTVLPTGGGLNGTSPIATPKGAHLTCNIYLFHRREEEWGPDAEKFEPDRWIGKKMPVDYMPFGAGARICVGRQMSLTQMSYILARFAQEFESLEVPARVGQRNLEHKLKPILAPAEGVKVILRRSKEVF